MKMHSSFGPNSRTVRMLMIAKGISLPTEELDIYAGENRSPEYLKKNPGGQMPALELDDGTIIAETIPICEYLEEKYPEPTLFGKTAEVRAVTRMWLRRVELNITEHMYNGFRYAEGLPILQDRMYCIPEAADGLKKKAYHGRKWLGDLVVGREFIAGDQISIADIVLFCCMDYCKDNGQPLDDDLPEIREWFERIKGLPLAKSSLHKDSATLGIAG